MTRAKFLALIAGVMLGILVVTPISPAWSQGADSTTAQQPPKGKGDKCIADTTVMRRNHMTMLKHQRDETMHQGVRGKPEGLTNCINCHATKGEDGQFVSYKDPKHFCRQCHDYAAVKLDCFECHASHPDANGTAALGIKTDIATANRFLSEHVAGNQDHTEGHQ
jgi:hypothetical protein